MLRRPKRRPRRCEALGQARLWWELRARFSARRQGKLRSPRHRRQAFLLCAPNTDMGFPTGSACVVRAARNSAREKWTGPNLQRKCRRQAKESRRRDIAPPRDARERRSSEPSCTQCRRRMVTRSIVRKAPLPAAVEKRLYTSGEKCRQEIRSRNDSAPGKLGGAGAEFFQSAGLQVGLRAGITLQVGIPKSERRGWPHSPLGQLWVCHYPAHPR
jgi:hypothetical protein